MDPALPLQVYAGPLAGGDLVAILFNTDSVPHNMTLDWGVLPLPSSQAMSVSTKDRMRVLTLLPFPDKCCAPMQVRDLYAHADLGTATGSLTLPVGPHDVRALRLSRQQQ